MCGHIKRSLDARIVLDIRNRAAAGEKHEVIASEYRITRATVGQVATGRLWPHIGGPRSKRPKGGNNVNGRVSEAQGC